MVAVLCVFFLRVLGVLQLMLGSLASHLSLKTHCLRLITQKLKSYTTINMEQNLEHHPGRKGNTCILKNTTRVLEIHNC
jgi:hypothetical protein